jgi:diguanylate cyclase (GGDEF)-like protein
LTPETLLVGALVGAFVAGRASQRHKVQELELERSTDQLTGLTNRVGLLEHLKKRAEAGSPYALLLLDLDGFKPVNDEHGHRVGDALLTEIGRRLREVQPGSGIAARLGGDEFVLVSGVHAEVERLAHRILQAVGAPIDLGLEGVPALTVGASIGVARGDVGSKFREVMHAADEAMYQAKNTRSHVAYSRTAQAWLSDAPTIRRRDVRAGLREPAAPHVGRACVLDPVWYHSSIT